MKNLFGENKMIKGTKDEFCPHCCQPMRVYRAVFGNQLASEFKWFIEHQGYNGIIVNTSTNKHNSTWLSYFGLLEQVKNSDGKKKPNTWKITSYGKDIIEGKEKVSKEIRQYNRRVIKSTATINWKEGLKIPQNDLRSDYDIPDEEELKKFTKIDLGT